MVQWPGLLLGYRVNLSHNVIPRGHSSAAAGCQPERLWPARAGDIVSEPEGRGAARHAAAGAAAPPREKKATPRRVQSRSAMAIRLPCETFIIRSGKLSEFHART